MAVRHQLARNKAAELLNSVGVKAAPIPLARIAKYLGAVVRYQPFEGEVSGLLYRDTNGVVVIGINSAHPPTRKRVTLAHELGHLLLHRAETLHIDNGFPVAFRDGLSETGTDVTEIEANQFAAALLMPEGLLRQDVLAQGISVDIDVAANRLAEKYQVSVAAMNIRLSRLNLLA